MFRSRFRGGGGGYQRGGPSGAGFQRGRQLGGLMPQAPMGPTLAPELPQFPNFIPDREGNMVLNPMRPQTAAMLMRDRYPLADEFSGAGGQLMNTQLGGGWRGGGGRGGRGRMPEGPSSDAPWLLPVGPPGGGAPSWRERAGRGGIRGPGPIEAPEAVPGFADLAQQRRRPALDALTRSGG